MNASLCRLAVLLTALAVLPARAADDKPSPDWVKIIDQGANDARLKGYKTPEGIKVEIVAEDPEVAMPLAMAFADDGTPYVLESLASDAKTGPTAEHTKPYHYKDGSVRMGFKWDRPYRGAIKVLSDTKGKGVYDKSQVVWEGEMPGGFLLHDGWLYVCEQGAVRRLKQSKPGGAYDVSEVVAQGFLGTGAVCGASVGPDGRLYITADDADNVVEGSDGSRATVLNTGAVFSCRPDGAKIETYAIGFVVPGEAVSFDAVGNVFHADSGYFPSQPGKFTHMRLIHVAEGADYGWRTSPSEPFKPDSYRTTMDGGLPGRMPPLLTLGTGFSYGLLIYNDTRLPENYRGLLFAADKESNAVHAFEVERKGATFVVKSQFDLLRSEEVSFKPGQPVLGPDGCIYIADSRDGTHGRTYRLSWAGTKDQPALPPRGMDSWAKIAKLGDDDLIKALANEDGSDRDHARQELARRGEKNRTALLKLLQDADMQDAPRIAALGALESMWNDDVQAATLAVLGRDSNADLRRLCADAVGLSAAKGDGDVHAALLRVLNDPAPEVRRSAALAMSRVAADGAADNLVNAWAFDDGRDAYLRDGLVRAIENLGQAGIDRLIALNESGVKKDTDKVVQAFTMTRTRPAADAVPRVLEYPHLSADQRAALVRSYENYLLDPPVSIQPLVDYLIAHPDEDAAVKQAGAEVLAAGGAARAAHDTGWLMGLLDDKDVKVRTSAAAALGRYFLSPANARRVGQAFLDGKLPPETRLHVIDVLRRVDDDPECARLLKAVLGDK